MSRKWLSWCTASARVHICFPVHISPCLCVCILLSETSAPPLLSSAIVLRMCGHSTLYLGMRRIGESRKGHGENVNELNESADPNVGCALSYIKAMFQQNRLHYAVDRSTAGVTERTHCVLPQAKKMDINDFLNTDKDKSIRKSSCFKWPILDLLFILKTVRQ